MTNDAALTRRRSDNPHQETWYIYFTDVRIGTIGVRAGVPIHADQWHWSVGFYPGMDPGTGRRGIAATFEAACEAFEAPWTELLPTIRERAFAEWRPIATGGPRLRPNEREASSIVRSET
ncbi:hypothetical protein ACVWZR_000554, partial [Bradyrhizobium sp. i1.3.1]